MAVNKPVGDNARKGAVKSARISQPSSAARLPLPSVTKRAASS
jgi:hypothetical protein